MGRALLFLTAGMFIIFGIVQIGVQNRASIIPERSYDYYEEIHATNAANSVMDYAIQELILDQDWQEGYSSTDFMGAEVDLTLYTQNDSNIPNNEIDTWNQFTLMVHGTVRFEDKIAESEVHLRKDSFSKYSYFTDFEPSNIYFIWSDEISGPVHTNGRFNIAGDPTFYGRVTSPQMWNGYSAMTNEPNFFGGSDFNAPDREPPNSFELNKLKNDASSGGLTFENKALLQFLNDGTIQVTEDVNGSWNNPAQYNVDMSAYNQIISSDEKLFVYGTVNGSYTIHSSNDIEIMADINYNQDPRTVPESTDMLGIVSEKSVIIDKNAHTVNGGTDLTIMASIMALDKSFSAENYNSGSARGDLNLVGGIIQQQRGPMGTFSGGSIASGFNKQYEYDERLESMVPPSFPRESIFTVIHRLTTVKPDTTQS